MPETTKRTKTAPAKKPAQRCDNHADRDAVFQTSNGGKHQMLHFCKDCIPTHWRSR